MAQYKLINGKWVDVTQEIEKTRQALFGNAKLDTAKRTENPIYAQEAGQRKASTELYDAQIRRIKADRSAELANQRSEALKLPNLWQATKELPRKTLTTARKIPSAVKKVDKFARPVIKEVGKDIVGTSVAVGQGVKTMLTPWNKDRKKSVNVFGKDYLTPTGYGDKAGKQARKGEYLKAAGTAGLGFLDIYSTFNLPAKGTKLLFSGGKYLKPAISSAITGAKYGLGYGLAGGASEGLRGKELAKRTAYSTAGGAVIGGAAGVGGVFIGDQVGKFKKNYGTYPAGLGIEDVTDKVANSFSKISDKKETAVLAKKLGMNLNAKQIKEIAGETNPEIIAEKLRLFKIEKGGTAAERGMKTADYIEELKDQSVKSQSLYPEEMIMEKGKLKPQYIAGRNSDVVQKLEANGYSKELVDEFKNEINARSKELVTKDDYTRVADETLDKIKTKFDGVLEPIKPLPKTDTLIEEAKKYKTAEEFVKAQGKPVYHGTNEKLKQFLPKTGTEKEAGNVGTYFTSSKNEAGGFGTNVVEGILPSNARTKKIYQDVKTERDIADEIFKAKKEGYDAITIEGRPVQRGVGFDIKAKRAELSEAENALKKVENDFFNDKITEKQYLESKEYTNFQKIKSELSPTHTIVFNPEKIKTKSQLIDFWNKSQPLQEAKLEPKTAEKAIMEQSKKESLLLERAVGDSKKVEQSLPKFQKDISYLDNTLKSQKVNLDLNIDNLKISKEGKKFIENTIEDIKPEFEKSLGKKLSNKEVIEEANKTSKVLKRTIGREETKQFEVALLNTRRKLSEMANTGTVDKEYLETLKTVKTIGSDIARKLQSLSIKADATSLSKQEILEAVLKVNDNTDEILKAAKGVNFNDADQAATFYRQFIKPKTSEWIDLIRYNSMLSSPTTHIINTFSNAVNTSVVAPIEKIVIGSIDFIGGKPRKAFAGEGGAYLKGYINSLGEATKRFSGVMSGKRAMTNLDLRFMPVATKGAKGKIVKALSVPTRLLEASDQFFTALTEAGETASLQYRKAKGVPVRMLESKAKETATYRVFRQDLFKKGQGSLLDSIDEFTSKLMSLRESDNPIVSLVSKFTVPFVKTPMNIFKQGVEYSPAGFATLKGATNKTEQLSKAIIGSTVFAGAATMLASGRITFSEPIGEKQKTQWRQAGMQSYSIKIGDKWVSYQKLPPALAFPFAMVAALDDSMKKGEVDDKFSDKVLSAIAKYGSFLSDQSYVKSIGDALSAVKGSESGIERLLSNYPQQLIPFRALGGWLARLSDDVQRKVDKDAGFLDKQIQLLMMNIPGLSKKVPARLNQNGEEIKNPNNIINSFSPVRVSTEDKEFKDFFTRAEELRAEKRTQAEARATQREQMQSFYEDWKAKGKTEQKELINDLTKEEYEAFKEIRSQEESERKELLKIKYGDKPKELMNEMMSLIAAGETEEADKIFNSMSAEEKETAELYKKEAEDKQLEIVYQDLMKMSERDREVLLAQARDGNPEKYQEIMQYSKTKKMNNEELEIANLQTNAEKIKTIKEELPTVKDKVKYVKNLQEKGAISAEVVTKLDDPDIDKYILSQSFQLLKLKGEDEMKKSLIELETEQLMRMAPEDRGAALSFLKKTEEDHYVAIMNKILKENDKRTKTEEELFSPMISNMQKGKIIADRLKLMNEEERVAWYARLSRLYVYATNRKNNKQYVFDQSGQVKKWIKYFMQVEIPK